LALAFEAARVSVIIVTPLIVPSENKQLPHPGPVAMPRCGNVPLDRSKFPLALASALRNAFADVLSSPLPQRLAALMRRLGADHDERSGDEPLAKSADEPVNISLTSLAIRAFTVGSARAALTSG
jgi:hypothetical protein